MKPPKIVFIGAGSMSFGIPTFRDIFSSPLMKNAKLCLVDINKDNLEHMYRLALKLNERSGLDLDISATTDRRKVLDGTDFVISSLAIERCELWKQDFNVPKKHGVRHCLGENGGPGALYFTMRTLPVVLGILKDMEKMCPDAYFLNFSNPESRIVLGASMFSKIRTVGLCHGIFMAQGQIAEILGMEYDDIEISAAGMNHFQWVLSIRDKVTGDDLYPVFREKEGQFDEAFLPYVRKMFHAFGLYPTCSDDHLGEYQAYGYEAGEHGYNFEWDELDRSRMRTEISEVTEGKVSPDKWLTPSGEKAVELLTAIHFNQKTFLPSAIVRNDGAIPQLPDDVAVEIPVMADADGIHKMMIPKIPDGIIGLLNNQVSAQRLSVLAAANGSKELAFQALLCDPVIHSTIAAKNINDELFEINSKYIMKCID
ncbi:MAG: family 4 glycosyl hydrolase [Saccharofermentanales bacterium]